MFSALGASSIATVRPEIKNYIDDSSISSAISEYTPS